MKSERRNRTPTYLKKAIEISNQRWLSHKPRKTSANQTLWNRHNFGKKDKDASGKY
jgi:hypothetical protein